MTVLLGCVGILCQFSKPDWFLETREIPSLMKQEWIGLHQSMMAYAFSAPFDTVAKMMGVTLKL